MKHVIYGKFKNILRKSQKQRKNPEKSKRNFKNFEKWKHVVKIDNNFVQDCCQKVSRKFTGNSIKYLFFSKISFTVFFRTNTRDIPFQFSFLNGISTEVECRIWSFFFLRPRKSSSCVITSWCLLLKVLPQSGF